MISIPMRLVVDDNGLAKLELSPEALDAVETLDEERTRQGKRSPVAIGYHGLDQTFIRILLVRGEIVETEIVPADPA